MNLNQKKALTAALAAVVVPLGVIGLSARVSHVQEQAAIASVMVEQDAAAAQSRKEARQGRRAERVTSTQTVEEAYAASTHGSFPETVKFLISHDTPGSGSREVRAMDATMLTFEVMPGVCDAVGLDLDFGYLQNAIASNLYQGSKLDFEQSANIAEGLISTAQEPGVCDEIAMNMGAGW